MKNLKKTLALILSVLLVLSCIPFSASAAEETVAGDEFTFEVIDFNEADPSSAYASITGYSGSDEYVEIPDRYVYTVGNTNWYLKVTAIGENAFAGNKDILAIKGNSYINLIGEGAFKDCENLTTVVFPSSVVLSRSAFEGCESLELVAIDKALSFRVKLSLDREDGEDDATYDARVAEAEAAEKEE